MNQNEPIAIKIHTQQDFINAAKSLISDKMREIMGLRSNRTGHFSKQMLLFHVFCPLCAQFLECYCYYFPYMFLIFVKIIFECYNLLIDLVP